MTTFTDVFERKEVKYRLGPWQHRALLEAIAGRLVPDEYGRTRIASLYLDTPERLLIERSLDKTRYKEKLRMRCYGSVGADDRVFVEIKKKFKGIVYKRRVACSLAAARAYLNGMPYEQACARFPLDDPEMAAESNAARSVQIAREIDAFVERHEPLRPSMLIACEREAYVPATGANAEADVRTAASPDDDLRITFDEDISYGDLFAPQTASPRPLLPLLPTGHAVMEIKAAGPFPLWLVRALDECKAYPSSFSKYGEAYRACMALERRRAPALATQRASQAAAEQKVARLAASLGGSRPRHLRVPAPASLGKKGGRCA